MKEYKCKDCIHYCVCKDTVTEDNWTDETPMEIKALFSPKYCDYFYPAADLAPVVHGEWKNHNTYVECLVCGAMPYSRSMFCPNCGADMNRGKSSELYKQLQKFGGHSNKPDKPDPIPTPAPLMGWVCPKCGAVMSPFQSCCVKCSGNWEITCGTGKAYNTTYTTECNGGNK